jgi:hypothetical protein
MPCETCKRFPAPTRHFEELEISKDRGTLFRCKECGTLFEFIEGERSHRFTPVEELKRYYSRARE